MSNTQRMRTVQHREGGLDLVLGQKRLPSAEAELLVKLGC